jgi:hypothetical protein
MTLGNNIVNKPISKLKAGEYGDYKGYVIGISFDSIGYTGKSKKFYWIGNNTSNIQKSSSWKRLKKHIDDVKDQTAPTGAKEIGMNFNVLKRNYLEKKLDLRLKVWNCGECNCYECPFLKACEDGTGKPSDFFKLAVKEIEQLS